MAGRAVAPDVIHVIVLHQEGAGDVIDSYMAASSLVNTLGPAVADVRRDQLLNRFERLEHEWRSMHTFTEP